MANLQASSIPVLTQNGNISNSSRTFETISHTHSSSSPVTTQIVRTGSGWYQWGGYVDAYATGPGTPPYKIFCPVQRNGSTGGVAYLDIHVTHRGMGGYLQYWRVAIASRYYGYSVTIDKYAHGGNRLRYMQLAPSFTFTEQEPPSTEGNATNYDGGYNAGDTGFAYATPFMFKIYTLWGAGEEIQWTCRSDTTEMYPPYKGPYVFTGGATPVRSDYI